MTRILIKRCEALATHGMSRADECGEQCLILVWNIVVDGHDGTQWVHQYVHRNENAGRMMAHLIKEHGSIDPTKWNECTPRRLSDYGI